MMKQLKAFIMSLVTPDSTAPPARQLEKQDADKPVASLNFV
jgi:hypothetical protein